ncbi:hypothetical protein GGR53DRAFT_516745 [Hypoxylon sp. FL1150]|nr:hypothetical protein GGR53DRAFT_516745 [Hypoxylon sp. FL1150]
MSQGHLNRASVAGLLVLSSPLKSSQAPSCPLIEIQLGTRAWPFLHIFIEKPWSAHATSGSRIRHEITRRRFDLLFILRSTWY